MDDDRAGVPGIIAVAPVRVPTRQESGYPFRSCAALSVYRAAAFSVPTRQQTGKVFRLLDESGDRGNGGRPRFHLWAWALSVHPIHNGGGCRRGGRLALLRAASI